MVIEETQLYTFHFRAEGKLLDFIWKEATAGMQDDDFKDALRSFALQAATQGARRLLVDLRNFKHAMGEGLVTWRDAEITPLYNKAKIEQFAYILPEGAPGTPADAPDRKGDGEDFFTRFFPSESAAHAWLGLAS